MGKPVARRGWKKHREKSIGEEINTGLDSLTIKGSSYRNVYFILHFEKAPHTTPTTIPAMTISVKQHFLPILLFLFTFRISAETYYDFDIGFGIGNLNHSWSEFIRYGGTVRVDNLLLHARVIDMYKHSASPYPPAIPSGQFLEAGILPGWMVNINYYIKVNFLGGLSFVYCTRFSENESFSSSDSPTTYRTIGLPFAIELLFLPLKQFGAGLAVSGNLNIPNSYIGTVFSVHYGKLR